MVKQGGTLKSVRTAILPPRQQADAYLSQTNPVSDQLYTVLNTTSNVEINSVWITVTWAANQPTNMRIIATVDGKTVTYTVAAPVSTSNYLVESSPLLADTAQLLISTGSTNQLYVHMGRTALSGQSVRIQMAITWTITQPTPMVCRVKYARW